jgi:CHAD domain-containing protein
MQDRDVIGAMPARLEPADDPLRLADSPPAITPPRPRVDVVVIDQKSPAADIVQAAIATGARRLFDQEEGVRRGDDDPEPVHQARVATRRLRSDLRTFRSLLDLEWSEPLREELKWLGSELGGVRDADVLLGRVNAATAQLPPGDRAAGQRLTDRVIERHAAARTELLTAMDGDRYDALLERINQAARDPQLLPDAAQPARKALPPLVRNPWRHLRRTVDALPADPADIELHQVRIRAKRCRYAAEAVAPVVGKAASEFADAIAELQDVLGEHHDAVEAEAWLRRVARETVDAREAFVIGELVVAEREAAERATKQWRGVWRAASRKRLRAWL